MTVSDIVPHDKRRYRIYIDGEFAFVLYPDDIRTYGITAGEEISSPVFEEITGSLLPLRAKKRAMNLLQKRDYTERGIRDKLSEGLYPEAVIDEAVEYLKSYRYIDDERFADDYIRYHIRDKSTGKIKQFLSQKGIDPGITDRLLASALEDEDEDPGVLQCKELLKKKHYDPATSTYEDKQKLMAFLYRKGYDSDTVRKAFLED